MDMSRFLPTCLALALAVSSSSLMAQADKEGIHADIDDGYAEIETLTRVLEGIGSTLQLLMRSAAHVPSLEAVPAE